MGADAAPIAMLRTIIGNPYLGAVNAKIPKLSSSCKGLEGQHPMMDTGSLTALSLSPSYIATSISK